MRLTFTPSAAARRTTAAAPALAVALAALAAATLPALAAAAEPIGSPASSSAVRPGDPSLASDRIVPGTGDKALIKEVVKPVSPAELVARQKAKDAKLVVLDVRTPAEYAAGHVPGAINVPHEQVSGRLAELAKYRDKDVVVYCRSGRRAGLAIDVLEKAGFRNLEHLQGDIEGWTKAGLPVEKP